MSAALARGRPAASPETLILNRRDVARLMDRKAWLAAAELGFRAGAEGRAASPMPMAIEAEGGAFHVKGARLTGERTYVAVKLNGNFPANPETHGLPTIQGALLLCNGGTGALLAIMDSIELTLRRTAAASALAARLLARPDSSILFIAGCGAQGRAHLEALAEVLPLTRCLAWDRQPGKAAAFAAANAGSGLAVEAVEALDRAEECDAIATCTTSSSAFLDETMVAPGAFVAAVGADSPHKSEIAPSLMARALVVADVAAQGAAMGDLRVAITAGAMRQADVHAELGELVTGRKPGRSSNKEIILFDSTGTALQDVAAAACIYERAVRLPGLASIALGEAA
ncbi:MAG: ornithine cyclodeaminase family protein [Sphingomonadaceae bacterium]|nr:ornithine cyclodeaminase family protein [Sphingomonadaceae bacterium]